MIRIPSQNSARYLFQGFGHVNLAIIPDCGCSGLQAILPLIGVTSIHTSSHRFASILLPRHGRSIKSRSDAGEGPTKRGNFPTRAFTAVRSTFVAISIIWHKTVDSPCSRQVDPTHNISSSGKYREMSMGDGERFMSIFEGRQTKHDSSSREGSTSPVQKT
jgi:hypothetical protein